MALISWDRITPVGKAAMKLSKPLLLRSSFATALVVIVGLNLTCVPVFAGKATSSDSETTKMLSVSIIKALFEGELNDGEGNYELRNIKWLEGSFTGKGDYNALVSFADYNQGHSSGWAELWLLRFVNGWKIDRKLEDHDWVDYEVIDIEKDGKLEIWVVSGACHQGFCPSRGKLLSYNQGSVSTLYSCVGIDNTGFGLDERELEYSEEKEVFLGHNVAFIDIDKDGIIEIVDLEEKAYYRWTGKIRDFSEESDSQYIKTSSTTKQSFYKLKDGKFDKIESPSTFSFPETIGWSCPTDAQCYYISGVPPRRWRIHERPSVTHQLLERIQAHMSPEDWEEINVFIKEQHGKEKEK